VPFPRLVLYVQWIERRKIAEAGESADKPTDPAIFELLNVIEQVKAEKENGQARPELEPWS
jgi:hypothetical protein